MESVPVSGWRWLPRLAAVALSVIGTLAVTTAPASAHGQLAMSRPVRDSTVAEPLQRLELYFTEQPASNAYFTVTTPAGVRVDHGWSYGAPQRLDEPVQEYFLVDGRFEPRLYHTGFPAMITVSHWPERGQYRISYLSVASDGEPVRGTVNFSYQGPVGGPPAGWTMPTDGPAATLTQAINGERPQAPGAGAPTGGIDDPDNTPRARTDRGAGTVSAWLLPGLLIAAVAAMLVHAARRSPDDNRRTPAAGQPARRRKAGAGRPSRRLSPPGL